MPDMTVEEIFNEVMKQRTTVLRSSPNPLEMTVILGRYEYCTLTANCKPWESYWQPQMKEDDDERLCGMRLLESNREHEISVMVSANRLSIFR